MMRFSKIELMQKIHKKRMVKNENMLKEKCLINSYCFLLGHASKFTIATEVTYKNNAVLDLRAARSEGRNVHSSRLL